MVTNENNYNGFSLLAMTVCIFATWSMSLTTTVAQQTTIAKACAADIKLLCADVQPGGGRLEACIKSHSKELSEECRTAQLKAAAIGKICAADIKKNCAGIQPGIMR